MHAVREVAVRDVDRVNRRIYEEGWMYVTALGGVPAPKYFAPYFTREAAGPDGSNGIQSYSRVRHTIEGQPDEIFVVSTLDAISPLDEEHATRWAQGLVQLRARWLREGQRWKTVILYFLDRPIFITHRIIKGDSTGLLRNRQIPPMFRLSLDDLLEPPSPRGPRS